MIYRNSDATPVTMKPGLVRRTLISGPNMMICEFTFDAGVDIPSHAHHHEQVGYVVKGRVKMTIDGQSFDLKSGDSYCAPSNIPHGALTLEPTIIIDTFNPPREDYRS